MIRKTLFSPLMYAAPNKNNNKRQQRFIILSRYDRTTMVKSCNTNKSVKFIVI